MTHHPRATHVLLIEGGKWMEFFPPTAYSAVHAILFEDATLWDCVNGWRSPPIEPLSKKGKLKRPSPHTPPTFKLTRSRLGNYYLYQHDPNYPLKDSLRWKQLGVFATRAAALDFIQDHSPAEIEYFDEKGERINQ